MLQSFAASRKLACLRLCVRFMRKEALMSTPKLLQNLHWLGHDSFRLDGPPVIYFDPWKLAPGNLAAAVGLAMTTVLGPLIFFTSAGEQ